MDIFACHQEIRVKREYYEVWLKTCSTLTFNRSPSMYHIESNDQTLIKRKLHENEHVIIYFARITILFLSCLNTFEDHVGKVHHHGLVPSDASNEHVTIDNQAMDWHHRVVLVVHQVISRVAAVLVALFVWITRTRTSRIVQIDTWIKFRSSSTAVYCLSAESLSTWSNMFLSDIVQLLLFMSDKLHRSSMRTMFVHRLNIVR
jgi:hypothetical protein